MTKKYCDICGTEIISDSQFGMLVRLSKVPSFDPKAQTTGMTIQEEHVELCEKCLKQISETLDKMKKQ